MAKICTILGARPQFIKASPLSIELRKEFQELIIHTGQHYDYGMSDIFFKELGIPIPDYHLGIGSATQGKQTGEMLTKIEEILIKEKPNIVLVYGDTNSTLAGALAAAKIHIPIAHVEAGLRSFNKKMPEEVNRIMTDHVSEWLFATSDVAVNNLQKENLTDGVFNVGDIMLDAILLHSKKSEEMQHVLQKLNITKKQYSLATIHRAENTDDKQNLINIFEAFGTINQQIILPLHPRTKQKIEDYGLSIAPNIIFSEPIGYLDMIVLMKNAKMILTDSGGIQKEAYYLKTPCITLREETEWVETVNAGWNIIVGTNPEKIVSASSSINNSSELSPHPNLYGDGNTSKKIVKILLEKGL
ncbi:MAG: UDP-N-acetylglucosamine 2-epimerase (non-hydrolyzing) [Cytophagales bacterium]|nr:MAG: UDP-N-acetylglucosamine 2-epimerase (non-hydrolyzing) [Cytophagales bacterium]